MKFLQNLSIRNKLIISALIPLIALLYYLQLNISQELNNKNAAREVFDDVTTIEKLSKVIHEFQRERAFTLSFLTSNGAMGKESLFNQRELTDKAISELAKTLKEQKKTIENIRSLDSISSVRAKVNALNINEENRIDTYYSGTKTVFLDEINIILRSSKNVSIKNSFEEH